MSAKNQPEMVVLMYGTSNINYLPENVRFEKTICVAVGELATTCSRPYLEYTCIYPDTIIVVDSYRSSTPGEFKRFCRVLKLMYPDYPLPTFIEGSVFTPYSLSWDIKQRIRNEFQDICDHVNGWIKLEFGK